jgi:hypothetical protein
MRRSLIVAVAAIGLFDCEQRFSSNPPPFAPGSVASSPSSGALEALLAPSTADAGPVASLEATRAMIITMCASTEQSCPASDADASGDARYRVVFGSGHAEIRSRGQAMADLYKEVRDRTAVGERLVAEPRVLGDGGAPAIQGMTEASAGKGDPVSQCAFHLLDLVDGVGEVTLSVVHEYGGSDCMVTLGRAAASGGASQCLIKAPERASRPGRGAGRGIPF